MARNDTSTSRLSGLTRRTRVVLACFVIAMTLTVGILTLNQQDTRGGQLVAAHMGMVETPQAEADPLFELEVPLDRQNWTGIVVHHLGEPAGDAGSIHRRHQNLGYDGLGYHFVIGNGNGLEDGAIEIGYRWSQQKYGAHVLGANGRYHNQHSIGICLVGNGNRRAPTKQQIASLISLTRRLQEKLDIPAASVYRHNDLATGVHSPGRYFPWAEYQLQIGDGG